MDRNGFMHLKQKGRWGRGCKNRRGNYVICPWAIINECWRNYSKQLANSIAVWKMDVLLKTRLACYSTWLQQKNTEASTHRPWSTLFGVNMQSLFLQKTKKKITLMYLQIKSLVCLCGTPEIRKRKLHCLSLGNYKSIFMQIYLKTDHLIVAYRKWICYLPQRLACYSTRLKPTNHTLA